MWLPFRLWDAQVETLKTISDNRFVVILKARQVGLTWLVLAFALWLMLFHPAATILLFSKRDDEAIEMLAFRLTGMYERLPDWMKCERVVTSNDHEWELSNGSRATAFPTTGGRSRSATMVVLDESDYIDDMGAVMSATQPTIDAGGRMIMLSSANKKTPLSRFKTLFREAFAKTISWTAVFLAWDAAPWRTQEWYAQKKADAERLDDLDDLTKEYPATWEEALTPASKDKRIRHEWVEQCAYEVELLSEQRRPRGIALPAIPGLVVYRLPESGHKYIVGADPAEGNPTSDDSAFEIIDRATGEQVASLAGKLQPEVFAAYIDTVGTVFNNADVLVERNNHGHAILVWLRQNSKLRRVKMPQPSGTGEPKEGWNTTPLSKSLMYDHAANAFRERETIIHNAETITQLMMVEGATLAAPEGMHDDRAMAYALALTARMIRMPEANIR